MSVSKAKSIVSLIGLSLMFSANSARADTLTTAKPINLIEIDLGDLDRQVAKSNRKSPLIGKQQLIEQRERRRRSLPYMMGGATPSSSGASSINRQANELKAKSSEWTKSGIKGASLSKSAHIAKIESGRQQDVDEVWRNPSYRTYYSRSYSLTSSGVMARRSYTIKDIPATLNRVSEVNADAEKKKRLTEAHYQRQVKDMQNMHHIRSRLLDESARNLQHEVTRGDSNMDPQHTTLFVRSYK